MRTLKLKAARRGLLAGAAAAVTAAVAAVPTPALAWKPKTHVYLAEEALRDATDDGKVTIYETDYRTGRIIGVLGTFEVDARILAALRAAPAQYRAGVLGPDAYPDILTGQQIIHPDEADSLDGGAGGSNGWLTYLWDRGFVNSSSPQVQAFTVGYLTHAAGDVFAHTYVNYFAGGEFQLTPDPTNAVKHLILEGYIGKRTPQTISSTTTRVRTGGPLNGRKRDDLGQDPVVGKDEVTYQDVNKPVSQEDTSIAGVERFIYDEMTYAKPGGVLESKLLKGDGASRSIPYIFSRLRNGLQQQVDTYDRERMARSGPERVAYAALNGPAAEYKRAWIKDIDEGLAAFPAVSHEVAKAIVYNESGGDMGRAKAVIGQYVEDHLASMAGVPDAAVSVASVINGILPQFLADALNELMKAPIDVLVRGATGKSADEWEGYLTHPETNFDKVLNRSGGGHDGEVEHRIDLASFNRDQLKIADSGFSNPSLKWKIEDLPPAFNTVQMTKLLMLSDAGRQQLDTALKAKGGSLGSAPGRNPNLMLGWVRSLDAGNQWQGLAGERAGASPRPAFSAGDAIAFQKLFLIQLGAKDIPGARSPEHAASPAPAPAPAPAPQPAGSVSLPPPPGVPSGPTAPVQDLKAYAGDWVTSRGRVTLTHGDDGVLRGRVMQPTDIPGREREGERLELRGGDKPGELAGTASYSASTARVVLTMSGDGRKFTATSQLPTQQTPSAWSGERVGPPPAPATPGATPATATPPAPPPAPPAPAAEPAKPAYEGVKTLGKYAVKVQAVNARDDGRIEVVTQLTNTSQGPVYLTSGALMVSVEDADGLSQRTGQFVRGSGEPPLLFDSTPALAPQSTARVRYLFRWPKGAALPAKMTFSDGARTVEFTGP